MDGCVYILSVCIYLCARICACIHVQYTYILTTTTIVNIYVHSFCFDIFIVILYDVSFKHIHLLQKQKNTLIVLSFLSKFPRISLSFTNLFPSAQKSETGKDWPFPLSPKYPADKIPTWNINPDSESHKTKQKQTGGTNVLLWLTTNQLLGPLLKPRSRPIIMFEAPWTVHTHSFSNLLNDARMLNAAMDNEWCILLLVVSALP